MKKLLLRMLILLIVALGATIYFRFDFIKQYAQPSEGTIAPVEALTGENQWPMGDDFDENWIGHDECEEMCPINFTYDYGVQYSDWYIGFVFEGQDLLNIALRYIKPDGTKYVNTGSILVYWRNIDDPTDNGHMYLYELKSSDPREVGDNIVELNCSNTDIFAGDFNTPTRCSRLAMQYLFDLLRGTGYWHRWDYDFQPNAYFITKLNEFKQAIDSETLIQIK